MLLHLMYARLSVVVGFISTTQLVPRSNYHNLEVNMIRHMQGETIVTLEEFRQFKGEFEQALERKDMKFKFNGDVFLTADAKRAVANYPDHVLDGYDGVTLVHTNMEV